MSVARDRLKNGYYNSLEASPTNPGGMARNGHRTNFPLALVDVGTVGQEIVDSNDAAVAAIIADNDATQAAIIADNAATVALVDADAAAANASKLAAAGSEGAAAGSATTASNAATDAKRTVANNFPDRLDATGSWFTEASVGDPGTVTNPTAAAISNVAGYGYEYTKANSQGQLYTKGALAAANGKFYEVEAEVEWTVKGGAETPSFTVGLQGLTAAFASTGAQVQAPLQAVGAIGVQTFKYRFGYAAPDGGAAWPQPATAIWLRPYVLFNRKSDNSGAVTASTARVRRLTVRDVTAIVNADASAAAAAASAGSIAFASNADAQAGTGTGVMGPVQTALAIAAQTSVRYAAKAAAYAVVAADRCGLIDATSGTWALTLPSAVTVGSGFFFYGKVSSNGKITFTPVGGQTIDGAATLVGYQGESRLIVSDGANWRTILLEAPQGPQFVARDEKAQNTGPGSGTQSTWNVRDLNTVSRSAAWASLSGNQVTVDPGTYFFRARSSGGGSGAWKTRLYNVTGAAQIAAGESGYINTSGTIVTEVVAEVTVAVTTTIRLETYLANAGSNFGIQTNAGAVEVYSTLEITRK